MNQIVAITGAGISAESGLRTFRDGDGYWRQYKYEEIASPSAWKNNKELVLAFYNERRHLLSKANPNAAHMALKMLENKYSVNIVTQNVDDLHERAGSANILHLHGEIVKARSTFDPNYIVDIGYKDILLGDTCPNGSQLRPHIVWFGEAVEMIKPAIEIISKANMIIIIGTSLAVYPAAGLIQYAQKSIPIYYIDPKACPIKGINCHIITEPASVGVPKLTQLLLDSAN